MPLIHLIGKIKILMYFNDHLPPHFHAQYQRYEEVIVIQTLDTYAGHLPTAQRKKVIAWAKEHQAFLQHTWETLSPPIP